MERIYQYPMPAVTADVALMDNHNHILLIKRGNDPFKDCWALPGGFVNLNEETKKAALRELAEETCMTLNAGDFELIDVYSKAGRDPRGWTITCAYLAVIYDPEYAPKAADDAVEVKWWSLHNLPELAFDHAEIIKDAQLKFYHKFGIVRNL